jgi:hypothetical protein
MLPRPIRQFCRLRLTHLSPPLPRLHVAAGQDHEHVRPAPRNRSNREHAPNVAFTTAPRPLPHKITGLDAFPKRFPFHAAALPLNMTMMVSEPNLVLYRREDADFDTFAIFDCTGRMSRAFEAARGRRSVRSWFCRLRRRP